MESKDRNTNCGIDYWRQITCAVAICFLGLCFSSIIAKWNLFSLLDEFDGAMNKEKCVIVKRYSS